MIEEVKKGNVVAFVGAGIFAAPPSDTSSSSTGSGRNWQGLPTWGTLMDALIKDLETQGLTSPSTISELKFLCEKKDYVPLAQYLSDHLPNFEDLVLKHNSISDLRDLHPTVQRRLLFLTGIPFRGLLTTNFTPCFPGAQSIVDGDGDCDFEKFLRNTTRGNSFHDLRFEAVQRELKRLEDLQTLSNGPVLTRAETPHIDLGGDVPVIHVHGKKKPVMTRRDYRNLLHKTPTYLPFMRSVFSSATVLFIGFSMSDEYIKELVSETLALVLDASKRPCFAVLSDKTKTEVEYYRNHDGIGVFAYDTKKYTDFSYVDRFLDSLYRNTSFPHLLAKQLSGKRILSIESPHYFPSSSSYGKQHGFWLIAKWLSRLAIAAAAVSPPTATTTTEAGAGATDTLTHRSTLRRNSREAANSVPATTTLTITATNTVANRREGNNEGDGSDSPTDSTATSVKFTLPGGGCIEVTSSVEIFSALVDSGNWDAFISYFGFQGQGSDPDLIRNLRIIRNQPFKKWGPCIVFSSGEHVEKNSIVVAKCGCVAYTWEWSNILFALTIALGKGELFCVEGR